MGQRLSFDVQLIVSDEIEPHRASEVLQAMLEDLEQDDSYHEVLVIDSVSVKDEAALQLLDMLETVEEEDIERAIEHVDTMEEQDG